MEKWTEKRPFPPCIPENDEEADMEELIRLGRALKNSGKTLEDVIGKEAGHSPRQTKTRGKEEVEKSARDLHWRLPRLQSVLIVSTTEGCVCMVEKLGMLLGNNRLQTVNNGCRTFF